MFVYGWVCRWIEGMFWWGGEQDVVRGGEDGGLVLDWMGMGWDEVGRSC